MSGPVEGRRWIVEGRVQGVGFRWFVSQEARRLGLAGWATNLPDGRVEVVARGEPDCLLQLERALGTGPTFARVDNVDKAHIPHEKITANRFDIR